MNNDLIFTLFLTIFNFIVLLLITWALRKHHKEMQEHIAAMRKSAGLPAEEEWKWPTTTK